MNLVIQILILFIATSCLLKDESPIETTSTSLDLIKSGDIIVSNLGNDSIVLLDEDGSFKEVLVDSPTDGTLIFNGLTYDSYTGSVLFLNDSTTGTLDAVRSIALTDGSVSTYLTNSNLNGVLPGFARLSGGDLVIIEGTTAAEMFNSDKIRQGAPFISTLTTAAADIQALQSGGFVVCSSATANTVRTYNAAGVVQATATSASPTPSLGALAATACIQDSSGRIIVAYSGATDAVRVYTSSTMATVAWTFTDTNVLTTPGKLAIRPNGNILVVDQALNHIVELTPDGAFVDLLGGAVLATPLNLIVVP